MKNLYVKWGIMLAAFVLLASCKQQTETIVISGQPEAASPEQQASQVEDTSADFRQITVGELYPVNTLDPLYADNSSSKRTVQLLYEGLTRFNASGTVEAAIADSWQISADSLTYTFNLRRAFYHDSPVFNNGTGRRVVASDFKKVFQRMAGNDVPPTAARLFMTISGFEPYYQEQHQVYNPSQRKLKGISGITAPNDSTLTITLETKDPHLMEKLASPYAVVYPMEAIQQDKGGLDTHPVGSGPFQFSQHLTDTLYTFSDFRGYWMNRDSDQRRPLADRIDVVTDVSEQSLLRDFFTGTVQVIPELGPDMMQMLLAADGSIKPDYRSRMNQLKTGGYSTLALYYNSSSSLPRDAAAAVINAINFRPLADSINASSLSVNYKTDYQQAPDRSTFANDIGMPASSNPFAQKLQAFMKKRLADKGLQLTTTQISVPTSQTGLYTQPFVADYPGQEPPSDSRELLQLEINHIGIIAPNVSNIHLNRLPWWIDLRSADIQTQGTY